jgi:S-adenosylmethionine hydrolase
MPGVISLTTDFGLHDPYVGIMKGVISRLSPRAVIVDLCHYVPEFRPEIAGLWVGLSYGWFAGGSIHVAVVDPGVGTERDIVCIDGDGHLFLVPDNGMAAQIARRLESWAAWRVDAQRLDLAVSSCTFHGRDIFAPLAARLWSGQLTPAELGPPGQRLRASPLPRADVQGNAVVGEVLYADRFGTLISNIEDPGPAAGSRLGASIEGRALRIVRTYGDADTDEAVALFNSYGLLEISRPGGSAVSSDGWQAGARVALLLQS